LIERACRCATRLLRRASSATAHVHVVPARPGTCRNFRHRNTCAALREGTGHRGSCNSARFRHAHHLFRDAVGLTVNQLSADRSANHRYGLSCDHDSFIRIPACTGTRAPNQCFGLACADQSHPRADLDTNDLWIPCIRAQHPVESNRQFPRCRHFGHSLWHCGDSDANIHSEIPDRGGRRSVPLQPAVVTGVFCTSGSKREFTLEERWYANEEIQAGADRDSAAAG